MKRRVRDRRQTTACRARWLGAIPSRERSARVLLMRWQRMQEPCDLLPLRSSEVREPLAASGVTPTGGTPEELSASIKRESAKWKRVIEVTGLRPSRR